MIKLVIFDFDGVLADTYEVYQQFLMKRFGFSRKRAQKMLDDTAVSMRKKHRMKWLVRRLENLYYSRFEKYIENEQRLYRDEVPELLDTLNVPSGVVTRSTVSVCREILGDQFDRFDFVYGRKNFLHKYQIIEEEIQKRNLKISEILFVTDTTADVYDVERILPREQILVTSWGFSPVKELKKLLPQTNILEKSLLEIQRFISKS